MIDIPSNADMSIEHESPCDVTGSPTGYHCLAPCVAILGTRGEPMQTAMMIDARRVKTMAISTSLMR